MVKSLITGQHHRNRGRIAHRHESRMDVFPVPQSTPVTAALIDQARKQPPDKVRTLRGAGVPGSTFARRVAHSRHFVDA